MKEAEEKGKLVSMKSPYEEKITLTNGQIINFCNPQFSQGQSFIKLQTGCSYSQAGGKVLYWLSKFYKEFTRVYSSVEKERFLLLNKYCLKDDDEKPILKYQFTPDQQKLFDEEVSKLNSPLIDQIKKLEEIFCLRDIQGKPIQSFTFAEGKMEEFQSEFEEEVITRKNILNFKKIIIDSDLLGTINFACTERKSEPLFVMDMTNLEPIIDFVE